LLVSGLAWSDGQPTEVVRWAFMHDFHEAYTGDIPTPLKRYLDGDALGDAKGRVGVLAELETQLDKTICEAFDVPYPGRIVRDIVKGYDAKAYDHEVEWFRSLTAPTLEPPPAVSPRTGLWGPGVQAFMDQTVFLFFKAGGKLGVIK